MAGADALAGDHARDRLRSDIRKVFEVHRGRFQDFSCDSSAESTSHAKAPDQVWLSDITYLCTREGWLYVCSVLDLSTREIVGWAIAGHMKVSWCRRHCGWLTRHASRRRG